MLLLFQELDCFTSTYPQNPCLLDENGFGHKLKWKLGYSYSGSQFKMKQSLRWDPAIHRKCLFILWSFFKSGCSPPRNELSLLPWDGFSYFLFQKRLVQWQNQVFQWNLGLYRDILLNWQGWVNKLSPRSTPGFCWLQVFPSKPLDHTASFSCKLQTTELPIHLLAS